MGWNYRAMRHTLDSDAPLGIPESYAIHEVYYRSDQVNDLTATSKDVGYSIEPVSPLAESIDDLRFRLTEMLGALDKPTLEYHGDSSSVQLTLSPDEAVVLFELVSRFTNSDTLGIEDKSEAHALWKVCSLLERRLAEPFSPNYEGILSAARQRLCSKEP
jgi:hypothetical protein